MKPPDTPLVAALRQTRRRIKRGWCQGVSSDGERLCLVAAAIAGSRAGLTQHVVDAIRRMLPVGWGSITAWNDAPGRTQKEVLAVVDAALTTARQEATNAI